MSALTGTATLLRLAVRRDRLRLPIWLILLPVLAMGTASAYDTLYPTAAERAGLNVQFGTNKAIAIITGPVRGLETAGGFTSWRLGGTLATLAALMALFLVVRHTRAEEESGRSDLVTAGRVGRLAPLASALILSVAACVALGVLLAAVMIAAGTPAAGSIALGLATTLCGVVFASVAALTSQLSTQARTASSIAGGALAVSFVARGIGDSSDALSFLSWLSPVGWAQQLRPYNGERWWVALLSVVLVGVLLTIATRIQLTRDVGEGVLTAGRGPANAPAGLASSGALAIRQHRTAFVAWLVGATVWGGLFGSLVNAIVDIAGSSPQIQEALKRMGGTQTIVQTFVGSGITQLCMITTCFAIQAILRMRDEETSGRAELLLATPTSRTTWLTSHLSIALVGVAVIVTTASAAVGLVGSLTSPEVSFADALATGAAHVPAAWIIAGACLCIYAWLPRLSALAWGLIGLAIALTLFGPILNLPTAVVKISPYSTAPVIGSGTFEGSTLAVHIGVAVVLVVLGYVGVRRRDIPK